MDFMRRLVKTTYLIDGLKAAAAKHQVAFQACSVAVCLVCSFQTVCLRILMMWQIFAMPKNLPSFSWYVGFGCVSCTVGI